MADCTCANPQMVADRLAPEGNSVAKQTKDSAEYLDQTLFSQARGGKHGALTVSFCDYAAPEYGGKGELGWTDFFQAAALIIAIANGVAQSAISDKQQDLADKYYDMARFKWDRFSQKYMPLEKELLAETSSAPIREIDCQGAESRADAAVNLAYDGTDAYVARMAKSYRICLDPTLVAYTDNRRNLMRVDTHNYNLSDERWFTDVKNDQRWNRRSNVLNLGRNLASEALKYGDVSRSLLKQVGGQLDRAAGGVIQALGYYGARHDTYYPTSYLGSASQPLVSIGQGTGSINPNSMNPAGGV